MSLESLFEVAFKVRDGLGAGRGIDEGREVGFTVDEDSLIHDFGFVDASFITNVERGGTSQSAVP